jgi:hypothetical protein
MSETYHPAVEQKMVTDPTSEDFGRVSDIELAHEAAIAANSKVSKEKSGDFYAEDIEQESDNQVALKIGEVAAKSAGDTDLGAAKRAIDVATRPTKEFLNSYDTDDVDKDVRIAVGSARNLELAAHQKRRSDAREAHRLAA